MMKTVEMIHKITRVHPKDNLIVALTDLFPGETVKYGEKEFKIKEKIPAKHKFVTRDMEAGDELYMYGVLVGKAQEHIAEGCAIRVSNVRHASGTYSVGERKTDWHSPDIEEFRDKTFMGFHREDGKVGTANYWLVVPLVFCENRNIEILQEALEKELGYGRNQNRRTEVRSLVKRYREGKPIDEIIETEITVDELSVENQRVFENVDGIKFITHQAGCGGTRGDAQTLCGLIAGYITHPNVAGATILSLGCQNAQVTMLTDEIKKRDKDLKKPVHILGHQRTGLRDDFISLAIKKTFAGLIYANEFARKPAPLSKLCIGLECGGSDGFSGISANPAIGYTSDLLVALGGSVILSEFPELCGVEQNISDRCVTREIAERFGHLMTVYNERAKAVGSGFDMNPSPGNIKDGLITDAIKSAGAAKKGGTSPVVDVLDYPEPVIRPGLNLLCTPGNDVESTTAEVGSGANIVLFTTGLGTPTGNPIAPVVKLSSNTKLAEKMKDIIDINTGTIIEGKETIEEAGRRILNFIIEVASGNIKVSAVRNLQDDFIPWKRDVSL